MTPPKKQLRARPLSLHFATPIEMQLGLPRCATPDFPSGILEQTDLPANFSEKYLQKFFFLSTPKQKTDFVCMLTAVHSMASFLHHNSSTLLLLASTFLVFTFTTISLFHQCLYFRSNISTTVAEPIIHRRGRPQNGDKNDQRSTVFDCSKLQFFKVKTDFLFYKSKTASSR